jgi:hypothetical protein
LFRAGESVLLPDDVQIVVFPAWKPIRVHFLTNFLNSPFLSCLLSVAYLQSGIDGPYHLLSWCRFSACAVSNGFDGLVDQVQLQRKAICVPVYIRYQFDGSNYLENKAIWIDSDQRIRGRFCYVRLRGCTKHEGFVTFLLSSPSSSQRP